MLLTRVYEYRMSLRTSSSSSYPLKLVTIHKANPHLFLMGMEPTGTVVFSTVGRANYGFDVFSVKLPTDFNSDHFHSLTEEHCLTDGISVSFNVQFVDDEGTIVYISEKTGSPRIYLSRSPIEQPEQLHSPQGSLFLDRPVVKDGQRLYFISAHEQPDKQFKSWSALYSTGLNDKKILRLTPSGHIDYSPAVSPSGKFIAVASYGSRTWAGEFHDMETDIVVIKESDPNTRVIVCKHGGWPTWSDDSTIYFHRQAEEGWWSIYRVDLPRDFDFAEAPYIPTRVTPAGLHCFTPAASLTSNKLAVATRRHDKSHRHIEIFDTESEKFYPVTELLHPNFHFYNPAFSPRSTFLGYHRFRGESIKSESTIPHLNPVSSPIQGLRMFRLNGNFPSFSSTSNLIAYNQDFDKNSGLKIIKSDGSKKWVLLRNRMAFYNSWSPTENNVIFTSIGPIFESPKTTVQIARISFDRAKLTDDSDFIEPSIKLLTDEGTGNNAFPSSSPDGCFIVFRSGRSGHKNLYVIDAVNGEFTGGSIRRLTEGPWIDTMPSWSPDGKLIAFSSNMHNPNNTEAFSIYVIKPDGSGLRRIHLSGVDGVEADRERLNHVCWSADCEWFLFAANLGGVTAEPVSLPNQFQPYGDLYMMRVDGSGLRRLTWNGYENGTPTWSPSVADVDTELARMSLNSGEKEIGDKLTGEFIDPLWLHCNV